MKFNNALRFSTFDNAVRFFSDILATGSGRDTGYELEYTKIFIEDSINDDLMDEAVVVTDTRGGFYIARYAYMDRREDDMYDANIEYFNDRALEGDVAGLLFACITAGFIPIELIRQIDHRREHPIISDGEVGRTHFARAMTNTQKALKLILA